MKVCNNCGTACKDEARFCAGCGYAFTTSTPIGYAQPQQTYNQAPPQQVYNQAQPQQVYNQGQPQTRNYSVAFEVPVRTPTQLSESDKALRLIAFILDLLTMVGCCVVLLPIPFLCVMLILLLAWMIPMTIVTWGIYKGTRRNTVAFGVCTLIFVNRVAGILLLCSQKDE